MNFNKYIYKCICYIYLTCGTYQVLSGLLLNFFINGIKNDNFFNIQKNYGLLYSNDLNFDYIVLYAKIMNEETI